jgi:methylornithine synthase
MKSFELENILTRARNGHGLTRQAMLALLKLDRGAQIEALFNTARQVRRSYARDRIYLYGFLYSSTHCRNNCRFCKFRRDNDGFRRYRKDVDQIIGAAIRLAASGVHLIDLTMGEDPALFGPGTDALPKLVGAVRRATGLPVMVSPGLLPSHHLERLAGAGADWYACYQETHSKRLFQYLRPGQDFRQRMTAKEAAREAGLLVEEGIICGIGESDRQVVDSLEAMAAMDADQVRVMKFVPQPGTPLAGNTGSDNLRERMIIAIMRLAFPDKLIPASLDVEGLKGLRQRLDAGANVVTSLVPPGEGFSGVAGSKLDIDNARRTAPAVRRVIDSAGLQVAHSEAFRQWMHRRRDTALRREPLWRSA